jgi:hypothetical protein
MDACKWMAFWWNEVACKPTGLLQGQIDDNLLYINFRILKKFQCSCSTFVNFRRILLKNHRKNRPNLGSPYSCRLCCSFFLLSMCECAFHEPTLHWAQFFCRCFVLMLCASCSCFVLCAQNHIFWSQIACFMLMLCAQCLAVRDKKTRIWRQATRAASVSVRV